MTIKAIYKVEGDRNEYETEQQAQVAECLENSERYFTDTEKLVIVKIITDRFFLIPHKEIEAKAVEVADCCKLDLQQ